ncbi:hypothetical protein [Nocardia asteroides]|nr:hypothetical protein [Nocardia asteroides]
MTRIPQRTRHHLADPDVPTPAPCAALGVEVVLIPPQKREH